MKKKIIILIMFFCVSGALEASEKLKCKVCGAVYSKSQYNFCPADGSPLTAEKFIIVNTTDSQPTPAAIAGAQRIRNNTEIERLKSEESKKRIKDSAAENTYDFEKSMAAIRKYYDTDSPLTFYLLKYLQQKYPDNLEVMKKLADYYLKMEEYGRAAEMLAKAESLLSSKLESRLNDELK